MATIFRVSIGRRGYSMLSSSTLKCRIESGGLSVAGLVHRILTRQDLEFNHSALANELHAFGPTFYDVWKSEGCGFLPLIRAVKHRAIVEPPGVIDFDSAAWFRLATVRLSQDPILQSRFGRCELRRSVGINHGRPQLFGEQEQTASETLARTAVQTVVLGFMCIL